MFKRFNKAKAALQSAVFTVTAMPFVVLANGSRTAESQLSYWQTLGALLKDLFILLLGAGGAIVFLLAAGVFVKDYILAKADHEKKFSIGQLVAGIIVASMMMYPAGSMMLGSDLGSGQGVDAIDATEFAIEPE